LQLEDGTLVAFCSDHGAFSPSAVRKPWRGAKADLYEGGVRVPLVLRWPREFDGGRSLGGAVSTADLFPTLLDLAGVGGPASPLDSVSLRPWLQDGRSGWSHDAFHWHFPHYHHLGLAPCGSVLKGRFKLVEWFDASIAGSGDRPPFELFDLEADPWEETDICEAYPDVRDELADELRRWRCEVGAQEMRVNPAFDPSAGGQEPEPPEADANES